MKFNMDEFTFQDEVYFMNLNHKMQSQQLEFNHTMGLNEDTLYHKIENES